MGDVSRAQDLGYRTDPNLFRYHTYIYLFRTEYLSPGHLLLPQDNPAMSGARHWYDLRNTTRDPTYQF